MNEITIEQIEEFDEMYGDELPSYTHEPIKFKYYWDMYLQVKNNESVDNTLNL